MGKAFVLTATTALIAAIGFGLALQKTETPEVTAIEGAPSPPQKTAKTTPHPRLQTNFLPAEAQQQGDVQIDGAISIDGNGQLVYNRALRRLFDFFIGNATGDDPLTDVFDQLSRYMEAHRIPADVAMEVTSTLEQYLAYRQAASQIPLASYDAPDLAQTFDALFSLRRQYLGRQVADAFFAEEEARDRYLIARRTIKGSKSVSEASRKAQLAALDAQRPRTIAQTQHNATAILRLDQTVQQLRNSGAPAHKVFEARAAAFGADAAERLEQLDTRREKWQQRVNTYQQARQRLESNKGLSVHDRQEAIRELQQQQFDDHEIRRIQALDRIAVSSPAS